MFKITFKNIINAWSPLANRVFLILWLATLFSNIGTWMQNAAAGWLMIELNSSALLVSLVQAATVFPLFIFAFPAGSLADILDKRKLLILMQIFLTVTMSILTLLVYYHHITPGLLLFFTFLSGAGAAIVYPSWQAIIPEIVNRNELTKAITLNGISMNLSRAIGPALTGVILVFAGMYFPFLLNAISYLGIIAALLWWKPSKQAHSKHPAENFLGSMKLGLRHVRANIRLRASIARAAFFLFFASCYWALMPLVANKQIKGGALLYGLLLGMVGVGAITGSFLLQDLRSKYNADQIVSLGTVGTAIALLLFGATHQPVVGLVASFIAGIAWITILPTLLSLAQLALPDWVRGRGIALYMTMQFGAMACGSALWGQLSNHIGISNAHYIAGAFILFTLFLTKVWPLHRDSLIDITPSHHWREPAVAVPIDNEDGPVLITIRYAVAIESREAFLKDIQFIKRQRLRTGAYFWQVFEDVEKPNNFIETFLVETWLEHLRQHERSIKHDLIVRDRIDGYLISKSEVTHFIARH